jgi:hypothetical protein
MSTLTQRADYVNTQTHAITRVRAHASPIRAARIVNDRTMLLFDPAAVVRVADSTRLPSWARTLDGGANLPALARRCVRSGAVLLERETLEVIRGVELYTIADWLDDFPGEGSVL